MIREIVTYPNGLLYEKSKEVENFNEELHVLLDDMFDTMMAKNGIGLAAVQIGELKRVLVICLPNENDEQLKENVLEVINPQILEAEDEIVYEEGCLSVPGFNEEVKRAKKIKVKYFDRFGNEVVKEATDLEAVAFQHEIDHLDGKLFIDRLSFFKRKKFEKEFKKKKKLKS